MTSNSVDAAPALRLQGVARHYGRGGALLKALDGVDLTVPRGQLLGLIGHNGAGKSTLFKLVLGLVAPSQGRLWVDGCEVGGRHFREARRRLGYLPENLVLYDNLDGLETLRFFARLKGAPLAQCATLLEEVGLSHAGRRPVREYSKGMRQRLGFAQALLGEPQLLLLDEPTTGLDPSAIRDFYAQLDRLRARGVTLVISSHILAELEQRVDALAMLSHGRLCAHGSVAALRERSTRPLQVRLQADAAVLDALPQQLAGLPGLGWQREGAHRASIDCPRALKMPLLQALAARPLVDLSVQEPTLEDLYFELREAA
ncbi:MULTISPECIES: ABC transporter ATP-binding protein [Roseateles]|uniref:Cu-processing system ATP-binding protein n=1 Tax=Pelomonas aquatica TaxID=431058 RepID=A0ABU1Z5V6_9BURK|nr:MULTISPECIES: ABC transporter ATP-binding protein [Roseateles]KQY88370.1 copper ABC transporter ATP-binding protein [Pelomonas sp. Root1444]MDR7296002.1 Cu-processing system ATP-binding protein [Pelomonas aquatica]